jgi:nitrous oxide reductase accessory protein NosL
MKYYFDLKDFKGDIWVNNYYTLLPLDALKAWYVMGSNIYGPMGNELIAFKTKEDAKSFLNEHHGQKIVKFSQITQKLIYDLDK